MARRLTPEMLDLVAERFKVLAEPARLSILTALQGGDLTVSELVDQTDLGQANVSKHLNILLRHGFVGRRRDGAFTRYSITDRDVKRLCEIMCKRIEAVSSARIRVLGAH
jgi:DNA-binding transcriptional ArsR family regulator